MNYHKVWYYYIADEEGHMHSVIVNDDGLLVYLDNNSYETGIEVFDILLATEEEYNQRYQ